MTPTVRYNLATCKDCGQKFGSPEFIAHRVCSKNYEAIVARIQQLERENAGLRELTKHVGPYQTALGYASRPATPPGEEDIELSPGGPLTDMFSDGVTTVTVPDNRNQPNPLLADWKVGDDFWSAALVDDVPYIGRHRITKLFDIGEGMTYITYGREDYGSSVSTRGEVKPFKTPGDAIRHLTNLVSDRLEELAATRLEILCRWQQMIATT